MKKIKCDLSRWYIFPKIFAAFGLLHLFDIPFWTRYGWEKPTPSGAFFWLGFSVISYFWIQYFCFEDEK